MQLANEEPARADAALEPRRA